MKKRVLAALLALVMLFGALPMSVFAEDLETVEEPSVTYEPEQDEEPTAPDYNDLKHIQIQVKDKQLSAVADCGRKNYSLIDGEWTIRKVDETTYAVAIQTAPYVEEYNRDVPYTDHVLDGTENTLTFKVEYRNGAWELQGSTPVINVKHEPERRPYTLSYDWNDRKSEHLWYTETWPSTEAISVNSPVKGANLTRDGYILLGWADDKNATTPDYLVGGTITLTWQNPTKTIYAVWEKQPQPDITDPTKVTPEFLDTASINYVCDTCTPPSYHIDITSAMYKVTEHSETTFRIKWNDEAILKAYNDLYPGHTWDEQGNGSSSYHIDPFAMTWTWDATTQKWTRSGSPIIRAYVKSTASSSTEAPTDAALSAGSFSIASVYCGYPVEKTPHNPYEMACSAVNYIEGSLVKNSAVKNADGTYTVKIRTAPYVEYFNDIYRRYNCPHAAKTNTVPVTLAYTPDGELSEWQVVTVNGEKQRADIPVYCEKAPDAPSITLTYNANAPEGKTVTNLPAPQKESIPEGSSVVTFQLSKDIPVCEGYKFLGWTTDTSSTIATFPVENLGTDNWVSTTGNPNYILYAVWEKNPFHVTYRLKDENGKWVNAYEEDVPVAGCENHTLWTPAEKTGYKFTGWYQKAEDIGKKGEVTELFDKTWVLYGDFTPVEYTITYDYRDKDIQEKKLYPENAETYTIEDTVTLNSIMNKGMFGKTFLEWRCDLDKDGVAEKITEIPVGTTGNLTVYAYWNYPVSYTVYDEDGNEVEAYCETINVPEDDFGETYKPKSVEKDGYEFDGWYQNPKNFGNPNKRTETLENANNWKLYGKLKYVEKPVYVYVQPTYKDSPLTKNDAKAVAALARLGFKEGFNAGGKFVTLGKLMTAKTDVAGMAGEIDNDKLALYSEIDTTKFNEHVLNSIGWYGEDALEFVTNSTHKGYEADGKIDAYHLNGTMSFQSVTFDTEAEDEVENMPEDGYYLVNDRITLGEPTREGYTSSAGALRRIRLSSPRTPRPTARRCIRQTMSGLSSATLPSPPSGSL